MGVSVSQSGKGAIVRGAAAERNGAVKRSSSSDVEPLEHHVPYGITGDRKAGQPPPGGGQ